MVNNTPIHQFKLTFIFLFATILISCERDIAVPELYLDLTTYSPPLIVDGTATIAKKDFDFDNDGVVDLSITNRAGNSGSGLTYYLYSEIDVPNTSLEIACILTADTLRKCLDTTPGTFYVLTTFNTYPPYVSPGIYAYDTVFFTKQTYYPAPLTTNTIDSSLSYVYQSNYTIHNNYSRIGAGLSGGIRNDQKTQYGLFRSPSSIKYIDFRINKTDGYHYGYIKLSTDGSLFSPFSEYIRLYEIYYRH